MAGQACSTYGQCQRTKRQTAKCGKLPPEQAEVNPWQTLCMDLMGTCTATWVRKNKETAPWVIAMIGPATGWIEIILIKTKCADVMANVCEQQ